MENNGLTPPSATSPTAGIRFFDTFGFIPMAKGALTDPLCPSGHGKFEVFVGVPGFDIAREVYCQNPVPSMLFGRPVSLAGPPACTQVVRT